MTAPEPVEVAAERTCWCGSWQGASVHPHGTGRYCGNTEDPDPLKLLLELCEAYQKIVALRADLARALPVVEAAGALVEQWTEIDVQTVRHMDAGFAKRLDALARAYRAAREPRTGEQG